jgi:TRAP-type C4-dicarboxylate transport system permease small subunit
VSDGLLDRLDRGWTKLEVALAVSVTALLVGSLVLWVALKGLSSRTTDTFVAGALFRVASCALPAGLVAFRLTRRRAVTAAALVAGSLLGWALRDVGVVWSQNLLGWLQDGCSLTLVGGLRGLGTRLTLWLALLGGSLATASGRHVSIDVATRTLQEPWRRVVSTVGGLVAVFVCVVTAWGFVDFAAVDAFGQPPQAAVSDKLAGVAQGTSRQLFVLRRQLALDARTLVPVLRGEPWDRTLSAQAWNEWLDAGDWATRYPPEVVAGLHESGAGTRAPLVAAPGEAARGLLVKTLNLVIPFGLVMIALRFVLWLLRGAPVSSAHGGGA